ncbi:MAG: hypothetical protein ACK55R_05850, partial [Cyanobacteriota bacterium]
TGELTPSATSEDRVAERVPRFEVDRSAPQRPSYTLTLTDPTGAAYTNGTQPTGAMMRSRRITGT